MPHYYIPEGFIQQHYLEHQRGETPEERIYCNICCSTPALQLVLSTHFPIFWQWISETYTAETYNTYTVFSFSKLEESINSRNVIHITQLLVSINFRQLIVLVEELSFYIRKLYVSTQRFIRVPTPSEELEAQQLYLAPTYSEQPNFTAPTNTPVPTPSIPSTRTTPTNSPPLQPQPNPAPMAQFMGENLIPNLNAQNNDNDNQDDEGGNNANNNHNHDSEEEEEEGGIPLQQPIFNPAALTTALQAVFGMNASNLTGRGSPIAKIEPFYGREDEDPVDWLKVFEKAAIANRWEAARRKRDIAASYLREAAADWYDRTKDIMGINWTSGYNNGNNFTDLFIKYFANETRRNRWYQELLTLRQSSNENVDTYANKFVKLLLRVDPENAIPQAQSKRMFLFSLNPAITPMVSMQNNADLGQLIDNARKAELALTMHK